MEENRYYFANIDGGYLTYYKKDEASLVVPVGSSGTFTHFWSPSHVRERFLPLNNDRLVERYRSEFELLVNDVKRRGSNV